MKLRSLFSCLALLSCAATALNAQSSTWSGGGATDVEWGDTANWDTAPVSNGLGAIYFSNASPFTSDLDSNFSAGAVYIEGGDLTLTSTGGYTLSTVDGVYITSGAGDNMILNLAIGGNEIYVNGPGTVTLGSTASTNSGITVMSGTLVDGVAGAYDTYLIMNGGTIDVNFSESTGGLFNYDTSTETGVVVIAPGATLRLGIYSGNPFTGSITGLGNIEKIAGGANTILAGTGNNFSGTTFIDAGATLQLGDGSRQGDLTGTSSVQGGGKLLFDEPSAETFAPPITSSLAVEIEGNGTVTFNTIQAYTNATTIDAGANFQLGDGTSVGNLAHSGMYGSGTLTFNEPSAVNFTTAINDSINVVQNGPFGAVTLSNTNVYSGTTTITNSTLRAGSTSAFGGTGYSDVTIGNASTLDLNGYDNTVGTLNGLGGNVTLGTAVLTIGKPGATAYFSGDISGTGSVVINGTGLTQYFNTANSYIGGTTIAKGELVLDNFDGSSATGPGNITIDAGATLQIGNDDSGMGDIDPAATVTDYGTLFINRSDMVTFGNTISGTGGLEVNGADNGIITISGANTYSGPTQLSDVTVYAGSSSAFGNGLTDLSLTNATLDLGSFNVSIGSLTGYGANTIRLSGKLSIGGSTLDSNYTGSITGSGGIETTGLEVLFTGNLQYYGATTIDTGTIFSLGNGSAVGANMSGTSGVLDSGTFQLAPGNTDAYVFIAPITGTGGVTIGGASGGTVTLTNTMGNTYSGLTSVNGGLLEDGAPNSFSSASNMLIDSASQGIIVNYDETVGNLENGGTGGPVDIVMGATLSSLGNAYTGDFNGVISGGGSIAVIGGQQGFSGNNTFTGGVSVTNGELWVGSDTALGTGTLTFNAAAEMSQDTNVTLANNIVLNGTFDNDDGGAYSMTLTGQISGSDEINWCTTGTLTLTGNNTFLGGVDMRSGYLTLASDTAAGNGGRILLNGGTGLTLNNGITVSNPIMTQNATNTLSGGGTFATAITADSTVAISAYNTSTNGPGTLTFSNGLTLAPGGKIQFDIFDANGAAGTGYSLISTSALNLTATASSFDIALQSITSTGNPADAANFSAGNAYSWVLVTSSTAITGFNAAAFNIDTSSFSNSIGSGYFTVSELGNSLQLNFTPVPEPSTWCLTGLGAVAVLGIALRRRRLATA